jgi:hypothetical protein
MHWRKGESLLELLLAIAIFLASVTALAALFIDAYTSHRKGLERGKANALALEGIEAVRSLRDHAWSNLSAGTKGVVVTSTGLWAFFSTSDTTDGVYIRQVELTSIDANTYHVTSSVSWLFSPTQRTTTTMATVLTNWRQTSGGGTSSCSWSTPVHRGTLNLSGTGDGSAVVVTGTTAYVGLRSASAPEFNIIDIASSTNPVLVGSLQISIHITALAVTGTYAYAGSDTNGTEITVINISNPTAPTAGTTVNLAGNGDVTDMAIVGNRLYVTRTAHSSNPTFHVIDITNPASPSELGSLNTGAGTNGVDVAPSGTPWAYIASAHNSQEVQNVNTTNPASMGVGGSFNFTGSEDAKDSAVSGTTLYVGSLARASAAEFQVVNVASPTSPTSLGALEFGANIQTVKARDAVVLVASASTTRDFSAINVSTPASPAFLSSLNLSVSPVAMDAANCRAVLVTADDTNTVFVIDGQ